MTSTPTSSHKTFRFLGTDMTMHAWGDLTGGALGLIEQVAPPGFAAPPHVHHAEDEAFYVVEGNVVFHRGEAAFAAAPGSFVWLPRDVAHWFEVGADGPARLLQFNTPAGLEQFFAELGTPPGEPAAGPALERLVEAASRYRIELLGGEPR